MSQPYVLPNRKAFADYIARLFLRSRQKDRDPLDQFDSDADLCMKRADASKNTTELLPHQKLVRDYLLAETPYRGLLFYHGLGTGKTCSAIGVAESLLSNRKVVVLLPASLQDNFRQELRKCGDPIYIQSNHWQVHILRSEADWEFPTSMGISDTFLRNQGRYFTTVPNMEPNWRTLPLDIQKGINDQISDLIDSRYTFINYNGLNSESVMKIVPDEDPSKSTVFNNRVIIIDEAHNLISRIVNKSDIARRIYDAIYHAKNCKVVALSGTPIINRPNEIAYLMNLLRGPIERIVLPVKAIDVWNESGMTAFFRKLPEVDTIEYNSIKRQILLTRNPENFKSVYNDKGERIAVKYTPELPMLSVSDWVKSFTSSFQSSFKGAMFGEPSMETLECLPTSLEEFASTFLDGLTIKNAFMFQRRIQGLVSYFKGADERMIPKRVDDDKMLEQIPMSDEQFVRYLELRWEEIQSESKKAQKGVAALNEDFSSYRVMSRLVCNYAVPKELRGTAKDRDEKEEIDKQAILAKLKENPDRFLSEAGLASYSPKLQKMLRNVRENIGTLDTGFRNQFIYSQYEELEGLGIFAAILEANGFQQYRLIKENGMYIEDPAMDPTKPAFAMYTSKTKETREMLRYIFNEDYPLLNRDFPAHAQSIRDSIAKRGGKHLLCIMMGTSAAAEGLTLLNVRNIHIMEPYWNPARHDQVIGRGIRICSHSSRHLIDGTTVPVPLEERTIRVSFYMSVFTPDQSGGIEFPNIVPIRRADTLPKYYAMKEDTGRPPDVFMSSDEFLYEISFEKERLAKALTMLLKQAAVDCEVHRKLHSREQPVIQCLRFDSASKPEDLAFHSNKKDDEPDDTYMRNTVRKTRHLQKVKIKDFLFLLDKDSKEVFDLPSYELDAQRLLKVGSLMGDRIQFFTYFF